MRTPATNDKAVGPILRKWIQTYSEPLNIVESPSVGTLAVSEATGELIDETLETMLQMSLIRKSTRVRVSCVDDHMGHLVLTVVDDAPWYDVTGQFSLATCGELAHRLGGTISSELEDAQFTVRLVVPLS